MLSLPRVCREMCVVGDKRPKQPRIWGICRIVSVNGIATQSSSRAGIRTKGKKERWASCRGKNDSDIILMTVQGGDKELLSNYYSFASEVNFIIF